MPRKSKTVQIDFRTQLDIFKKAIAESPTLSTNAVLLKNLQEFERLIYLQDTLYSEFDTPDKVMSIDSRGNTIVNPAIAAYHKNHALLLKTSEYIEKATSTLVIGGGVKTW